MVFLSRSMYSSRFSGSWKLTGRMKKTNKINKKIPMATISEPSPLKAYQSPPMKEAKASFKKAFILNESNFMIMRIKP